MASSIPDHLLTAENRAQVEKVLSDLAPQQLDLKEKATYASKILDEMAPCPRCRGLGLIKEEYNFIVIDKDCPGWCQPPPNTRSHIPHLFSTVTASATHTTTT